MTQGLEIVPANIESSVNLLPGMTREDVVEYVRSIDKTGQLSWSQVKMFLIQCYEMKLDPRRNQIYAIPRWNKNSGRNELTTVVSIDGFRLVAERTGKYAPGQPTLYLRDKEGRLIGATVFVKKQTQDGTWHEVSETAFICEYRPKQGASHFWINMPSVMIAKVAEARALRRAFPDTFSGIYSRDEMDQSESVNDGVGVTQEPESLEDPTLSDNAFDKLMALLDGDAELESRIKKLCQLTDLRKMRYSQCMAVRKYVDKYRSNGVSCGTEKA